MTTAARRAPTRGTEAEGAKPGTVPAPASPVEAGTAAEVSGAPETRAAPAFAAIGDLAEVAAATLTAARDHLLGLQDPRGWWIGELETNVTMDAEDVLLRHFLGILTDTDLKETAVWIRSQQRADGTWANFYGGPGDLSTTVEAYVALRLAGDQPDAPHMRTAAEWITTSGGLTATRVFTRMWLALSGLWSWDALPVIPPEVIYLPSWFPLNIYDWGCWARQTIVALAVVSSFKPSNPLPFTIDELYAATPGLPPKADQKDAWSVAFNTLDKALHKVEPKIPARARRAALRRCTDWIVARQEADGCWGGIQPPWVYSIMALTLMGYGLDNPIVKKALDGIEGFTIREDGMRRIEACQSPVWDTVLTMVALEDAGLAADHPALVSAAGWLLDEEIRQPGDWAVRRPHTDPGGWAFEFENDNYADTDDSAEVILALRRVDLAERNPANRAAIRRGLRWLEGMQSKDGGWGAFDADNTRELINKLPFCDFGAVIDPPSADVTAHIVEAFAAEGLASETACRRGVIWLLKNQEPDGSWFGRWGANYLYGTGAVVPALIAAGVRPHKPQIRRAVAWLESVQNADGGWGEDLRSYDDPNAWSGRGASTASQTAWALLALLAAGERDGAAVERGIRWLAATQRADGTWDEPYFTGTGFPRDFYLNYHLYRLAFPVSALGRFVGGAGVVPRKEQSYVRGT
ncbi:squalene--hopene cyclase [Trebonia kvetii]|uniref:Squalene--hopene cyclase n=1 Tax=Trebonia kvetii TaxID=2480626 RepID=A0A6P2C452_9ACTN|nr:squalene--hopene cyclase [Trebonia kvetii]TVZ06199.1 squalene--hopene cyclase [Trebonia kvetii]